MMKNNKKPGFTLIELTLAVTFISLLLLAIAWLTIHITSTYEKGLAIKAVNSVGKELIDDFSRSIAGSPAMTVESICNSVYVPSSNSSRERDRKKCLDDRASRIIYQQRYGTVKIKGKEQVVPTSGVFCTGRYTYLWNTAYALNSTDYENGFKFRATFSDSSGNVNNEFRLLKVPDFNRQLCKSHMETTSYAYDGNLYFTLDGDAEAVELLDNSENDLALYDLRIFPPTVHSLTNSAFYSGTFILATLRGSIDITATGDFCSDPPDNLDTDFAYCAINKFNFAMKASGESISTERRK